jgi:hypothetical protein
MHLTGKILTMRKITPVGKLSLYLGSLFLFFATLLMLALYMDDQSASWFNGVSTSLLWPIDLLLVALGLLGVMFMLRWGRAEPEEEVEILHFTALVNNHNINNHHNGEFVDKKNKDLEAGGEVQHHYEFESEVASNEDKTAKEFESDAP